ncbi:DNA alkylation repair protein [Bacillus canaveralius]|uniref:DNA alkylation repair protein n=1 Tax=Bacillus canaveralius TaxID=1403243 RepID=A0A2N5GIZ3_9BACI|nr:MULTISPECIES: DNA alkylation repair protein [Bacillus]PLR81024.1 DNA alkylation repair protein [Bacillus canaveralius]PLR81615.1 DNA alkylation repair protein [Bacillus sp. V33-4]PLR99000.1 DNA alkylation repair protein [Bacillus canaveralius]RSK51799.1 DNA alkylation repair protein [Bacillus canaveralius]
MNTPYRCPSCRTNRSRFNIIEQVPHSVKKHPQTGQILEEYTSETLSPFHTPYKGPLYKVQCAICGLIQDEQPFIQFGQNQL